MLHRGFRIPAGAVFALLLAAPTVAHAQQLKANIRMTGGALDGPATGTMYFNGSKMRLELTASAGMPAPPPVPPYGHGSAMPPGYAPMSPQAYPMSPGALYFQPPPHGLSPTGQMRLLEIDEIPSQYKLGSGGRRWLIYVVAGALAVSVAAAVTFLIIRLTPKSVPTVGSVHVESFPPGGDVLFDGTRLTDKTPLTIDHAPVGTRHTIRIELAGHQPFEETIDIPRSGNEVSVLAKLAQVTGKILINSVPANAEIYINGQLRGRTPTTIQGVDMGSARRLELRLKEHQPFVQDLIWPADGVIRIDTKLVR
jgi:hypothetical protein